jgi:hypothetical protein
MVPLLEKGCLSSRSARLNWLPTIDMSIRRKLAIAKGFVGTSVTGDWLQAFRGTLIMFFCCDSYAVTAFVTKEPIAGGLWTLAHPSQAKRRLEWGTDRW